MQKVKLTAEMMLAFSQVYLVAGFDDPKPTPEFHMNGWKDYCSDHPYCSVIAPRGHAKSSAFTHVFTIATVVFRVEDYIILVGSNEEMAIEMLGDMAREFRDNEQLRQDFQIVELPTDAKTDLIIRFADGHECRIIARGSGQKMRGRKWKGKRPGLIVCDDLEDDEQVESLDRRIKFRRWFTRALIPVMRRGGKLRIHGTILHEDSLLNRLRKNKAWKVQFYSAHKSFDDFSEILWPEQFTVERLKLIRQSFIDDGDAAGYSQEYLNDPLDNSEAYLRKEGFVPMTEDDFDTDVRIYVGTDFAISKKDKANRTSFTVGGVCAKNFLYIIGQHVDRWDSLEIVDQMFKINSMYNPEYFFVEDGVIWKALRPILEREMRDRNDFLPIIAILPIKDKAARGKSYQKRHRAKNVRYNTNAEWYPGYFAEQMKFTGHSEATLDDQFDSTATLCIGLDNLPSLDETDFRTQEEIEEDRQIELMNMSGVCPITGY